MESGFVNVVSSLFVRELKHATSDRPKYIEVYSWFEGMWLGYGYMRNRSALVCIYYIVADSWYHRVFFLKMACSRTVYRWGTQCSWLLMLQWVNLVFGWWSGSTGLILRLGLFLRSYYSLWILSLNTKMLIQMCYGHMRRYIWQYFKEFFIEVHVKYAMRYWLLELRKIHFHKEWKGSLVLFNVKLICLNYYKVLFDAWSRVFLVELFGPVNFCWRLWSFFLLHSNPCLVVVNTIKSMKFTRSWKFFRRNTQIGGHQNVDRRCWGFGLSSFNDYLSITQLWWKWLFEITILVGIIKPVFTGSKEQDIYFIYEYFKLEL